MHEFRLLPSIFMYYINFLILIVHQLLGVKKLTTYVNYAKYLSARCSSSDGYFTMHTERHGLHFALIKKELHY